MFTQAKRGSCERICTRISYEVGESGGGPRGELDAPSTRPRRRRRAAAGLDKGRRRDLLRPLRADRGEEGGTRIKRGREMARMPHYACTPGGRVRE